MTTFRAHDELRRLFNEVDPDPSGEATELHPAEAVWDAVAGRLDRRTTEAMVLRSGEDPGLAAEWRLAAEVQRRLAEEARSSDVDVPLRSGWRSWLAGLAAAAALVLVAGIVPLLRGPLSPPSELRREAVEALRPIPAESEGLPRDGCVLAWTPGPEGSRYDVEVATGELQVLLEVRDLAEPRLAVLPELLRPLPPGAELLWRVDVITPDGRRTPSPTFVHRLQ